jgi:hypothetical protein
LQFFARAEDTITLSSGKVVKGEISHEDPDTIYLKLPDGEALAIAKSRISKIERVQIKKVAGPAPAKGTDIPAAPEAKKEVPSLVEKNITKIYNELKELGSSDPAKRKAALEMALQKKDESLPVMLGMLNPKTPTDEWTHIGVLRALAEFAPLPDQAAQTLAWSAIFDQYPEARREACNTMRRLQDDRATRQLVTLSTSENPKQRLAGAVALHEIDDNRVLAALIRAVPMPSVNANVSDPNRQAGPDYSLPVGPQGTRLPIFLPKSEIAGTASDVGSPVADLLKQIAGKDLGSLPYGWINWYREKNGEITAEDRETYREKRSVRDRINAP